MLIFNNIDINEYKEKVKNNTNKLKLINSMMNYYGTVSVSDFLDYYLKYYNIEKIDKYELDSILFAERQNQIRVINSGSDIYFIKNEYLYENTDKTLMLKIIASLEDDLYSYDYKEIELDDLLKYNDIFYYKETPETKKFKEYLIKQNVTPEKANELIEGLINTYKIDCSNASLFTNDIFSEIDYELNDSNIDEIMSYINEIVINIPVWGSKGWTNKEIILSKYFK